MPARNLVFLAVAMGVAEARGVDVVYLGVNALDYSGYPDCRPEFVRAFEAAAALALKRGVEGNPVAVRTPLIDLTKADIVRLGRSLDAPLHLTWSCYRGDERPVRALRRVRAAGRGVRRGGRDRPRLGPVTRTLVVSEVFGPTLQGEGPSAGPRAGFVRLGRCSLNCSWCDTRYHVGLEAPRPGGGAPRAAPSTRWPRRSARWMCRWWSITGGEPLLQQRALVDLLRLLPELRVEVETNGIHAPEPELVGRVERFNVSPKLANAGIERGRRYKPDVLRAFTSHAARPSSSSSCADRSTSTRSTHGRPSAGSPTSG